jgi:diamine N-acetyltransferase
MVAELKRVDVHWRIAESQGQPIAYAKLTPLNAPAADPKPGAMELQQIYVLPE